MPEDININNRPRNNRTFAGLLLLVVGCGLLLRQVNSIFFPDWLFDWPMILIVLGLYTGAKHDFKNPTWLILFVLGILFLLNDILPHFNVGGLIWPIIVITIGIWLILKRHQQFNRADFQIKFKNRSEQWNWQNMPPVTPGAEPPVAGAADYKSYAHVPPSGDDYLNAVSIFGGVKKIILSKNFKGGEIVNIFGGAELDFTQADISGRVVIDIVQIFGGTKIIVPSNWQVVSDLAAVFASVDDKRIKSTASPDSVKILVLTGASIFAGVDVRSF
jgi:predicted membrane protein